MYEGGWKNGKKYGQGTMYINGDKYTGQWDGNYEGQGEINYKDGTKYKGYWDWKDGGFKRHGQELNTLQTDKYSTKGSGTKTSFKARSNAKIYCIVLKSKV